MTRPTDNLDDYRAEWREILDPTPDDLCLFRESEAPSSIAAGLAFLKRKLTTVMNLYVLDTTLPNCVPPGDLWPTRSMDIDMAYLLSIECERCTGTSFHNIGSMMLFADESGYICTMNMPTVLLDDARSASDKVLPIVFLASAGEFSRVDEWVDVSGFESPATRGGLPLPFLGVQLDWEDVWLEACWDWAAVREAKQRGTLRGKYDFTCLGCGFHLSVSSDRIDPVLPELVRQGRHVVSVQWLEKAANRAPRPGGTR